MTLFQERSGDGPTRLPVVLLHGLTATHRYVVMGSKALQRAGHDVLAYDARGHGASDPAPTTEAYTYADLAQDLISVMDEAGFERAVLAGASMGAHTAVRVALEHPERVAGLVLVTPAYDPESWPGDLARWDALSDGLRDGGVEGFVEAYGEEGPEKWRATLQTVLRQRLGAHEHPDAVADALKAVPRSRPFETREQLREIAMPDRRRRRPRRARPWSPAGHRRVVRLADPGRAPDRRGGGPEPDRVAGRAAVEGHRRGRRGGGSRLGVSAARRVSAMSAGYSGTPLVTKLGIKPGMQAAILSAPEGFDATLGALPDGVAVTTRLGGSKDMVILFVTERAVLAKRLDALRAAIAPDGMVWVAWPKKAAKMDTNITEDVVREVVLPTGLVDVKVCAIDATWSGLKIVIRKELR